MPAAVRAAAFEWDAGLDVAACGACVELAAVVATAAAAAAEAPGEAFAEDGVAPAMKGSNCFAINGK